MDTCKKCVLIYVLCEYSDHGVHYLEIELLADHGVLLPPQMQGLTDEQISELHLVDEWADKCVPSGGTVERNDPVGRRNGKGSLQFYEFYI